MVQTHNRKIKNQIAASLLLAIQMHAGQSRKDAAKTPYVFHPIRVMQLLYRVGVRDADLLRSALLHDVLEDTSLTFEQLKAKEGPRVARLVLDVSIPPEIAAGLAKSEYLVRHASNMSKRARLLKRADRNANLYDILLERPVGWSTKAVARYFDASRRLFDALGPGCPLLDSLSRRLLSLYNQKIKKQADFFVNSVPLSVSRFFDYF